MTTPSHAIAIVGGGFSGTALAIHLLDAGGPGLAVHVVEPRARLGCGIAYGDAAPEHILNVPAERMSLWTDRPDDFLAWARLHGPRLGWPQAAAAMAASYLPRRLYGHYLQTRLDEVVHRARQRGGPVLVRHAAPATDLRAAEGAFHLELGAGPVVPAHDVVLATGHAAPAQPFPIEGESHRFIADPWRPGALAAISRHDSVLVTGTGLSMVDVLFSLDAAGHRGEVVAVSRHGLLPRVHGQTETVAPVLAADDMRRGIVHALRQFRRAVATGWADWRSAVDGLRPVTDALWRALPPAEQDRFLRHLKPYWDVHRHRMPSQSADLLLRRPGLTVEAARVARLVRDPDGVEAVLQPRGTTAIRRRRFHWVVNCTPPGASTRVAGTLVSHLRASGLLRPDRTGMGVDIAPDGTVLDGTGQPVAGLFALGPLRRGHAAEATSVPHIRPQVQALTALLLGRAGHRRQMAGPEHHAREERA